MKNVRLFPKTFLYVFSLMAAVVLVSHALFYFMMPAAYTWQKETALKKTQTLLIEELRESLNSSSVLHDEITDAFRSYAIQNQMGIFMRVKPIFIWQIPCFRRAVTPRCRENMNPAGVYGAKK